jgi:hypothetical protein
MNEFLVLSSNLNTLFNINTDSFSASYKQIVENVFITQLPSWIILENNMLTINPTNLSEFNFKGDSFESLEFHI